LNVLIFTSRLDIHNLFLITNILHSSAINIESNSFNQTNNIFNGSLRLLGDAKNNLLDRASNAYFFILGEDENG